MKLMESPFANVRTAALMVAALATVVYANSLHNEFAYDDVHIITENTGIHSLDGIPGALTEPYWPGNYGKQWVILKYSMSQ